MLFIGAANDRYTEEMRQVSQAATHAAANRVEVVAGANHGVALLDPAREPQADRLSALILGFCRQHAS